jgi:hypothetical protein
MAVEDEELLARILHGLCAEVMDQEGHGRRLPIHVGCGERERKAALFREERFQAAAVRSVSWEISWSLRDDPRHGR